MGSNFSKMAFAVSLGSLCCWLVLHSGLTYQTHDHIVTRCTIFVVARHCLIVCTFSSLNNSDASFRFGIAFVAPLIFYHIAAKLKYVCEHEMCCEMFTLSVKFRFSDCRSSSKPTGMHAVSGSVALYSSSRNPE